VLRKKGKIPAHLSFVDVKPLQEVHLQKTSSSGLFKKSSGGDEPKEKDDKKDKKDKEGSKESSGGLGKRLSRRFSKSFSKEDLEAGVQEEAKDSSKGDKKEKSEKKEKGDKSDKGEKEKSKEKSKDKKEKGKGKEKPEDAKEGSLKKLKRRSLSFTGKPKLDGDHSESETSVSFFKRSQILSLFPPLSSALIILPVLCTKCLTSPRNRKRILYRKAVKKKN
jgi:hypothetical protein